MLALLIGTRKGLWILRGDEARSTWTLEQPHHFGSTIHHAVQDPRDGTILAAARTGHLGPTLFRSSDGGATWSEASTPPAFPKSEEADKQRAVHHNFWLTPGTPATPGRWYLGTSPAGLFVSDDAGQTWTGVSGFNDHPMRGTWCPDGGEASTPDGAKTHSILIDPRDPAHLYMGLSIGGTFESSDGGATWSPLNKGVAMDYAPPGDYEFGHDPHCMAIHPANPDRLYMQNHCGVYRIDRPSDTWTRIGENLPKEVGDIGFPVVVHPRDPDTAWVFPMDGTDVWPRTSPGGKPAAYRTSDAGASWERQDEGFPPEQAWFSVKRQCMAADSEPSLGLYVGTSSGEVYASTDEGASWACVARHLPHVYSVEVASL